MILERDHQAFHWAQWTERDQHDERQPKRGMNPIWRPEENFDYQRGADHDRASEEHDKYRRSVSGIDKRVVKAAIFTTRLQGQKTLEQSAFAAAWTRTGQPRADLSG